MPEIIATPDAEQYRADPARVRTQRNVSTIAAMDTIDAITDRVAAMLSHNRRLSLARRYLDRDAPVRLTAGLTLAEPVRRWTRDGASGIVVHLNPGLAGFGISSRPEEVATERQGWARYHDGDRVELTHVTLDGGLAGDGPAATDGLTIRRWNVNGVGEEIVVAFDYGLTVLAADLQHHIETLRDQQPWDNRGMFHRILTELTAAPPEPR